MFVTYHFDSTLLKSFVMTVHKSGINQFNAVFYTNIYLYYRCCSWPKKLDNSSKSRIFDCVCKLLIEFVHN